MNDKHPFEASLPGITRRAFLAAAGSGALIALAGCGHFYWPRSRKAKSIATGNAFGRGWQLQASEVAPVKGEEVSTPAADVKGWYAVNIPSTVMAALVAAGEYPDLMVGDNLKKASKIRFRKAWWYRKEFASPALGAGEQAWLYFKGINYRANLFLNGVKIADSQTVVGTYRDFEFNITPHLAPAGAANVLAVEVSPPDPKVDLGITFVDWAPAAPDANMGLWQDVELRTSGGVAIRYPHVLTDFEMPNPKTAKLSVLADLVNATDKPVTGTLSGEIGKIHFSEKVTLAAGETKTVTLSPETHAELTITNPRLWWPWQLGKPEMYELGLTFSIDGKLSDQSTTPFGIRSVSSRLQEGSLLFTVNGTDLLIVGGGYCPDLLQRRNGAEPGDAAQSEPAARKTYQEDHIRYARDMNLNTIRGESKLEDDAFYDLCDKHGMLFMAGWCCCSPWEQWKKWKPEQTTVAMESLKYQIRRARTHPSMLVFLNGSDNHPTEEIEKQYLAIEADLKWPCPTISSATAKKSTVTGESGVKMDGPYKWVPPIYWLTDTKKGGAHGFNTEVGPGACPPPLESLERMLPADHRWPMDDIWNYHCGGGTFANMKDFTEAMDARFGKPQSIADFAWKAQAQAYETIRAMYEGFRRNKFNSGGTATGEIQWMLNNAWPSMIWHLYDYYFRPGGAYFATKLGCEPLHALYSYDNRSIVVANDTLVEHKGLTLTAAIYDIDSKLRHEQTAKCDAPANLSKSVFTLEEVEGISSAYFLRLTLKDERGHAVSTNSYFLSTKPDVLDFKKEVSDDWAITPCASYADFTALDKLPKVNLALSGFAVSKAAGSAANEDGEDEAQVTVSNTSGAIALMVRLKLTAGKGGEEILPIRWEDNYFTLLPNEKRRIKACYLRADAQGKAPDMSVDCYNNGRG